MGHSWDSNLAAWLNYPTTWDSPPPQEPRNVPSLPSQTHLDGLTHFLHLCDHCLHTVVARHQHCDAITELALPHTHTGQPLELEDDVYSCTLPSQPEPPGRGLPCPPTIRAAIPEI